MHFSDLPIMANLLYHLSLYKDFETLLSLSVGTEEKLQNASWIQIPDLPKAIKHTGFR